MILGSLCVLIAACWSNFLVEFAAIKFTSVVCGFNSEGIMRFLCEIREKSGDHLRFRKDIGMIRSVPNSKPCVGGYNRCSGGDRDRDEDGGGEDDDGECHPEDEEFNVLALRMLVKKERKRANAACDELKEERAAATTAIDETMAMIVRLQGEKSAAEVRANQERRMAEQKQVYDQVVIESLRWMLARSEDRREVLEGRLRRWGRRLKMSDDDDDDHHQDDYSADSEDEEADKERLLMEESLSADDDDHRDVMIISSLEFDSLERET